MSSASLGPGPHGLTLHTERQSWAFLLGEPGHTGLPSGRFCLLRGCTWADTGRRCPASPGGGERGPDHPEDELEGFHCLASSLLLLPLHFLSKTEIQREEIYSKFLLLILFLQFSGVPTLQIFFR